MQDHSLTAEEKLVTLIGSHQAVLHRYILTLLPDRALADDVLQETNLVLWRKAADYDSARPFLPWAMAIARFQVQAARRDSKRDLHVFNDELVDVLAQEAASAENNSAPMDHALEQCLKELPAKQREIILARYKRNGSVKVIAAEQGRTPTAISLLLMRIRKTLMQCIEQKVSLS